MPALLRAWTRARNRSKYAWSNFVRLNFNPPSVANPGPVLIQGNGLTVKSGGEDSVVGKLLNFRSSVHQSRVKLCPCALRKLAKASKSNGRTAPLLPQSCNVFQVCDPHRMSGVPLASWK